MRQKPKWKKYIFRNHSHCWKKIGICLVRNVLFRIWRFGDLILNATKYSSKKIVENFFSIFFQRKNEQSSNSIIAYCDEHERDYLNLREYTMPVHYARSFDENKFQIKS